MLRIDSVSKSYGEKVAIRDISFEVPRGSVYGLLGPNGAGKTSLIRIINQIQPANSGTVYFNDKVLDANAVLKIGYLPEERGLYKKMKVGEQVIYLARLKGMTKSDAVTKLKWWFDRLDISDWWNKRVETLSKGMQQKVQFIATVMHQPELIILDEPFSGFDPVNAEVVKDELARLRSEGATIMLSTHRMESVEELCDHVAMIHQSEKVLDGTISEVKRAHKKNQFEVKYRGEAMESLSTDMAEIVSADFDNDHLAHKLVFSVSEEKEAIIILRQLMDCREVVGFGEMLPSIQEIFVKIAKTNNEQ